jgi:aspartyl-tRNA(Asn)/glutamyl-tRNA(Gln) amidotransferase subunit C
MSHSFTRDDLGRIARLAKLELDASEQDLFSTQVAGILAYAEQIQRVDTTGVEPTSHAASAEGSLRADIVRPSLPRESALASAPDADIAAGLFKVPRVIG